MTKNTHFHRIVSDRTLTKRFLQFGRVQIRDFLKPDTAEQWTAVAKSQLPWVLNFRDGGKPAEMVESDYLAMSAPLRDSMHSRIDALAREDFQYIYWSCSLSPTNLKKLEPGHALHSIASVLMSRAFVEEMRQIVGDSQIRGMTASVTRYDRGHFLLPHDDKDGTDDRRAAFVLNLSADWWPDWGGLLQFIDADRNVTESFSPHNNSLSLFKVPQMHAVSYVTPHAHQPRCAIAGWLIA